VSALGLAGDNGLGRQVLIPAEWSGRRSSPRRNKKSAFQIRSSWAQFLILERFVRLDFSITYVFSTSPSFPIPPAGTTSSDLLIKDTNSARSFGVTEGRARETLSLSCVGGPPAASYGSDASRLQIGNPVANPVATSCLEGEERMVEGRSSSLNHLKPDFRGNTPSIPAFHFARGHRKHSFLLHLVLGSPSDTSSRVRMSHEMWRKAIPQKRAAKIMLASALLTMRPNSPDLRPAFAEKGTSGTSGK
jgi:hypothetical protein